MSDLQIENTLSEGLARKFKVLLTADKLANAIDQKVVEIQPKYRQKGFRDGKVPANVIKQKYAESLLGEVANDVAQESLTQIQKQLTDEHFAGQPEFTPISMELGKDLEFEVSLELLPKFAKIELEKLNLHSVQLEVDESDLQESIEHDLQRCKEWVAQAADYVSQKGDAVKIDFVGRIDGQEFAGGKMDGYQLELGSGSFIPGFEEQLEGHRASEEVLVKVTFPADYHAKDLAGKEAEFTTQIHEVLSSKRAELTDETAKKFLHADSVADYKDKLKKNLLANCQHDLVDDLMEEFFAVVEQDLQNIELPKKIYEAELETERTANRRLEEAERKSDQEVEAEAHKTVLRSLLMGSLAHEYQIEVSDQEVFESIMKFAQFYPGQEKAIFEMYARNERMLMEIRANRLQEKIYNFIAEKVQTEKQNMSLKDYKKMREERKHKKNSK